MMDAADEKGFSLVKTISASRDAVFSSWTGPDELGWFFSGNGGPGENTTDPGLVQVDLRIGGAWTQTMVIDEETSYVTGGVYKKIVPEEKLVFAWGAADGWPDPVLDRLVCSVVLESVEEGTELTFRLALPVDVSDEAERAWFDAGIREGWEQTLDRLVAKYGSS